MQGASCIYCSAVPSLHCINIAPAMGTRAICFVLYFPVKSMSVRDKFATNTSLVVRSMVILIYSFDEREIWKGFAVPVIVGR